MPSSETTEVVGVNPQITTATDFSQGISDTAGDSFDGTNVREDDASKAQDTCYGLWSNKTQVTGVTQGNWPVAGGMVAGQHNTWGFDSVGWTAEYIDYYRIQAPAHGVAIPCGFTMYQAMKIWCPGGVWVTYTPSYGNKLTGTIDQTDVKNCRYDMDNSICQTIIY